jgi:microcystin-dependent protein
MGALGAVGGAERVTLTVDQVPAHSHSITDQSHSHGASFSPSGSVSVQLSMIDGTILGFGAPDTGLLRAHGQNQNWESGNVRVNGGFGGSVSVNSSSTGITGTNETGGGQPVSVVPPAMAINYLVKD